MLLAARDGEWSVRWLSRPFVAAFHFGATPISFWIALLLATCTACAIPATRVARTRDFVALMLMLEGTMLGLFLARDLLVFALFWDLMLVPVFFALVGWGEHPATAWRYFIYNFAGGLTLLLATAAFGVIYGSTDVIGRSGAHLVGAWAPWIYAGFALLSWSRRRYGRFTPGCRRLTADCRRRWSRSSPRCSRRRGSTDFSRSGSRCFPTTCASMPIR